MRSDRVYTYAAKGGWLLVGALLSCGPSQDGVLLISVSDLPARATKLTVKASLDGKAAMQAMDFSTPIDRFAVTPPQGTVGHLILNIQAFDADGCVQANGQVDTTLTGQHTELPVAFHAQNPRTCGTLAGCAAGTICAFTPKPVTSNLWGMWANSPTDIWAVGDYSVALHYDGTIWQDTTVLVDSSFNSVWGSSSSDVWAVGQRGSIIHYKDAPV